MYIPLAYPVYSVALPVLMPSVLRPVELGFSVLLSDDSSSEIPGFPRNPHNSSSLYPPFRQEIFVDLPFVGLTGAADDLPEKQKRKTA